RMVSTRCAKIGKRRKSAILPSGAGAHPRAGAPGCAFCIAGCKTAAEGFAQWDDRRARGMGSLAILRKSLAEMAQFRDWHGLCCSNGKPFPKG
ncbi:MAG TPA: hypothetical protein VFF94_11195, partial [Novosphingobium sp.]|nr:hypothetical protein [Novosphingobium sp.]